ncbi:MAG: hypothetical protein OEW58_08010 [Gammaproteobacteria bacterium]|nr:hypothetical protein [Gammaproteobacteria bacterium]
MLNELSPIVDQWYQHPDQGQPFLIVDIDDDAEAIEIQYFDGTMDELSFSEWEGMTIEECATPDSWSGGLEEPDAEIDEITAEFLDDDDDWNNSYETMG